jgi:hypothetical protein
MGIPPIPHKEPTMTTVLTPGSLAAFLRSSSASSQQSPQPRKSNPRAVALKVREQDKRAAQERRALVARLRRNGWSI